MYLVGKILANHGWPVFRKIIIVHMHGHVHSLFRVFCRVNGSGIPCIPWFRVLLLICLSDTFERESTSNTLEAVEGMISLRDESGSGRLELLPRALRFSNTIFTVMCYKCFKILVVENFDESMQFHQICHHQNFVLYSIIMLNQVRAHWRPACLVPWNCFCRRCVCVCVCVCMRACVSACACVCVCLRCYKLISNLYNQLNKFVAFRNAMKLSMHRRGLCNEARLWQIKVIRLC